MCHNVDQISSSVDHGKLKSRKAHILSENISVLGRMPKQLASGPSQANMANRASEPGAFMWAIRPYKGALLEERRG